MIAWIFDKFDKNVREVKRQVRTRNPAAAYATFEQLSSWHWPKWRIWMVMASAYKVEAENAYREVRAFNLVRYARLLEHVGDYPDGYTHEDAKKLFEQVV